MTNDKQPSLPPTPDPWTDEAPIHKDASRCTAASPAECGRAHLQRPTRPGPVQASPIAQGEEGTEADAFDRSRVAYDEILADASDARRLRANVEALRAQLAEVTAERDGLNEAAILALSGEVCTPAEGYVKAGSNWLKHDIETLIGLKNGALKVIEEGIETERKLTAERDRASGDREIALKEWRDAGNLAANLKRERDHSRAQLAHYRDIAQRAAVDSTDPVRWLGVLEEIAEGVW